jgi:hypothetical protein
MGKASRRRRGGATDSQESARRTKVEPPPFVARPFEGLPGETDWVALREIIPAGTATVRLAGAAAVGQDGTPGEATVATVLPLAWPALHRADGTVFVGSQSGSATGDASRDLAQSLLAALAAEPGTPVVSVPPATADTPRLQDLLDTSEPLEVTVHEGFEFWVGDTELDEEGRASLERANASAVPTTPMAAAASAYWCRIGRRTHVRLVLPEDEEAATDALARLHAAGESALGPGTRLLGAFRACGLLVPVWDLDSAKDAGAYEEALGAFVQRYAAALAAAGPLTAEERRARSGLLSRQVTLR